MIMKKIFIFCALCCVSMLISAQNNSCVQLLVNNIATDISITTEQTQLLQNIAEDYVAAMQQANQQFSDDTERTKAKEGISKNFQEALQEILTAEQYAELMRVREERRNQLKTRQ